MFISQNLQKILTKLHPLPIFITYILAIYVAVLVCLKLKCVRQLFLAVILYGDDVIFME